MFLLKKKSLWFLQPANLFGFVSIQYDKCQVLRELVYGYLHRN